MKKTTNYINSVKVTYSTSEALTPTAVALRKFDGLHRGHQPVIEPILNQVKRKEYAASISRREAFALHELASRKSQVSP